MRRTKRDHSHRRWWKDDPPPPKRIRIRYGLFLPWLIIFGLGTFLYLAYEAPHFGVGAKTTISGSASVTDGDTIRINGQRIRLHGIDAPESDQTCTDNSGGKWRCGHHATVALSRKIGWNSVLCRQTDTDRYRRLVAICEVDGDDLNSWMVRRGWAVAYTRYSFRYLPDELVARWNKSGIWLGDFTNPEDWRHRRRR